MHNFIFIVAFLGLSYSLNGLAETQVHHQSHHDHENHSTESDQTHSAHEHGIARLFVAVEQQNLEIEFQSPAINLIGFEHKATSETELVIIQKTQALLNKPHSIFGIQKSSECQPLQNHIDMGQENSSDHSDIKAHYRFQCSTISGLSLLKLFELFPAIESIDAQWVTEDHQKAQKITASEPHIVLE